MVLSMWPHSLYIVFYLNETKTYSSGSQMVWLQDPQSLLNNEPQPKSRKFFLISQPYLIKMMLVKSEIVQNITECQHTKTTA